MHADETVVEVRKDGRPAGSESRMWVYRSGELEPFLRRAVHTTQEIFHALIYL